ncbi:MAG: hypothetical protein U0T83_08665 [Bacteriovoracaceae bacterium]
MKLKLFIITIIISLAGFANAEEFIHCEVFDGTATAYFCKFHGGGSKSGTFYIDAYDYRGSSAGSSFCIGIAIVINGCEKLCSVSVDNDADFCRVRKKNL